MIQNIGRDESLAIEHRDHPLSRLDAAILVFCTLVSGASVALVGWWKLDVIQPVR
jgi:hypothetical protein